MKHLYPLLILLMGTLLVACSKETSKDGPQFGNCEYAPYTIGSSFSYSNIKNDSKDTFNYTLTVSGDTTIRGTTYKKIGDDSVFTGSNCKDGVYTQIASMPTYQGGRADDLKLTYLREYMPQGSIWLDTIKIVNAQDTSTGILLYTILDRGITKAVNGKNYLEVISVRTDAYSVMHGGPVPAGTIATRYYAKGVGLIEEDKPTDTTRITSYILKP
ncbi:hypothetical protein [Chitinophaga nivalis]|uniref:Uncharacterized protein n=1 Tax=Chitinophaga nivalis TaxID=2991709 RepID=A0ABT3IVN5_9BACT|nr:hypothetical protein [Chitinophaga nivalis]MCW3462353.1 hypothetical protein [Chitinophaga nivalis]MCW3487956.1 hypothetical protein [Chitinophaga nivalis]